MTATPIPRTLALTLYGELDVSIIDELPPGRKPIRTALRGEDRREAIFEFAGDQVRQGRQVYVVYPLIEESEKADYKSAVEAYDELRHGPVGRVRRGLATRAHAWLRKRPQSWRILSKTGFKS